jgi:hypothetical protein
MYGLARVVAKPGESKMMSSVVMQEGINELGAAVIVCSSIVHVSLNGVARILEAQGACFWG